MYKVHWLILLLVISTLGVSGQTKNRVENPGFENGNTGWNFWGGEIVAEAHSGAKGMKVNEEKAKWSGADQFIYCPEQTYSVEISGYIKTRNVKVGEKNWQKARIALEFHDNEGRVGGYPTPVGTATGTQDWTKASHTYTFPDNASKIKLQAVLANCTGTAWFDDIKVTLLNKNGNVITHKAKGDQGPCSKGKWYDLSPRSENTGSHYVDWSGLLDAPAGKHGFVKAKGNNLVFEDGTKAVFWGTNLVGDDCFPSKKKADSLAKRLAQAGVNLVRFHHMDAPWAKPNIFKSGSGTRELDKQSLDKLDYLIAQLKEKGIYTYLDLLVHRDFSKADIIENKPPELGGKQVAHFDPDIIKLQKEFITQLLSHKNPYTGNKYHNEPAIAGSEIINESSIFGYFGGDLLTEPYRKTLKQQYREAGYKTELIPFSLTWNEAGFPKLDAKGSDKAIQNSLEFMVDREKQYFQTIEEHMRDLGVQYPISGSNFLSILPIQYNNTHLDAMIANNYWDHPKVWQIGGDWSRILEAPFDNKSMIKNPSQSIIGHVSRQQWKDKPLMITEYNICYPNEYRLEGAPFVAAYSKLQGIDALMQFDFNYKLPGAAPLEPFKTSMMPSHMAQWVVTAPMFHKGYVQEATETVVDTISKKEILSLPGYSDFLDQHNELPFITRVIRSEAEVKSQKPSEYKDYINRDKGIIQSSTGELSLHHKSGYMKINASRIQGVTGALEGNTFNFPLMEIDLENPWASVIAVSKDNNPLRQSGHFYLTVVTPTKMTGQQYNKSRQKLLKPGELPVQAQIADGTVTFTNDKPYKVYPLSITGKRKDPLPVTKSGDKTRLPLQEGRSFVYEVIVKK